MSFSRNLYAELGQIPPVAESKPPMEDVSTEGGALRCENADLKRQIELAHHALDIMFPGLPRDAPNGLAYTVAGRLQNGREKIL